MKLFEFEGKHLLERSDIEIPEAKVVSSAEELVTAAKDFPRAMVKAQVLHGKRKKLGLIKACMDEKEIVEFGTKLFVNKVEKILLEQILAIENEYYLGIAFSTKYRAPVAIISMEGGIDIEETKKDYPEKVAIVPIDLSFDIGEWFFREVASQAGFTCLTLVKISEIMLKLWHCFKTNGCMVAEINPLIQQMIMILLLGTQKLNWTTTLAINFLTMFFLSEAQQEMTQQKMKLLQGK